MIRARWNSLSAESAGTAAGPTGQAAESLLQCLGRLVVRNVRSDHVRLTEEKPTKAPICTTAYPSPFGARGAIGEESEKTNGTHGTSTPADSFEQGAGFPGVLLAPGHATMLRHSTEAGEDFPDCSAFEEENSMMPQRGSCPAPPTGTRKQTSSQKETLGGTLPSGHRRNHLNASVALQLV